MAETAVSFVLDHVYQHLMEEGILVKNVHKEFEEVRYELESIRAFLKDADRRAADEGDTKEGIKTWVKQLREVSFRIEDAIDEYMIYVAHKTHHYDASMCIASFQKFAFLITSMKHRHRIASEIQDIKLSVCRIKERSERYNFQTSFEEGSSGSRTRSSGHDPRMASSLFIEENEEVVGFELPRDQLVSWLVEGGTQTTVISVVGMGGLGKTTLAKKVFYTQKVRGHFDCCACIPVSQSYTIRGLLVEMIEQFCRETKEPLPQSIHKMDEKSLITQVRQYLQQKRYLIFFDDVWKEDFSDDIELVMPNNNKGSRIIITTRMMHAAEYFKKSFPVHVHNLQLLPPNKAWELFCKKAFRFELDGHCPPELESMSNEIVEQCKGLPLAIVAIGGLLSSKAKTMFEWDKVRQNLSMELERNAHLTSFTKILSLSYNDLPYYLKPCFLYFGIYPKDCCVSRGRLIRQWIAEGFVKSEEKRTLEQVAVDYLSELIQRSLVQVSKSGYGGKIKSCQIHDLLREVIIRKMKDLSFCHLVHDDDEVVPIETTRRLAIATRSSDVLRSIGNSHIRAIYAFEEGQSSSEPLMDGFYAKFKFSKIVDFEGTWLNYVPDNLGNLYHLKYLNLKNTRVKVLPKSVGKLQNLETLDLRQTFVHELPIEINKLTKLRHLLVYHRNYDASYSILGFTSGVLMQKGIGGLTSLQTLYFVEVDHGGVDLIQELEKLRQLRRLGLRRVRREYGYALCALIQAMKHLEALNITAIAEDETIDLSFISSPPQLRQLHLKTRLEKLPKWIPKLEYLVKLRLAFSMLKDDPLKSLKNLPNLLWLAILDKAYDGETLHFQEGGFPKLKILFLAHLNRVNTITIDKGALVVLEEFKINNIPHLKELSYGIRHLEKLKLMEFANMPDEFVESIDPEKGQDYYIIKHVPLVYISRKVGPKFYNYDIRPIHRQGTSYLDNFSEHKHMIVFGFC